MTPTTNEIQRGIWTNTNRYICPKCQTHIDAHGDHIYHCPKYAFPRDIVHDSFRDAFFCVLDCLAPLANFTAHADEVLHEPSNLLPEQPHLRPADVALSHESQSNPHFRLTLFDVSTATRPIDTSLPLDDTRVTPNLTTEQVTKLHEHAENKKIHGPNRPATRYPLVGEQLILTLNNRKLLLRPLTIDPYGQFGPLVYQTLYGTSGPHHPHDANQRHRTGLGHAAAKHMLEQNFHSAAPSALLPKADKQWKSNLADAGKHHSTHWFTGSYHAQLPSQWAEQVLAFNTSLALSKYFYNAVRRLRTTDTSATTSTVSDPVPGYTHYSSLSPRHRNSRLHTRSSRPHS